MLNRRNLLAIILLLTTLSLMVFQSTRQPFRPLPRIQNSLVQLMDLFDDAYERVTYPVRLYTRIRDENVQLRKEVARLRLQVQRDEEIRLENKRLKRLLHVKERQHSIVAVARVISSGLRKWPAIILINKGKKDGIKKDMTVRTADGLVGKIVEVMPEYSRVLLLTDPGFSASVRIQSTRTEAIITGRGDGRCILKYLPKEEPLERGQLLVTSGLDGIFPKGIPVGYIDSIAGSDELFVTVNVKPVIGINRLEEVMIIR